MNTYKLEKGKEYLLITVHMTEEKLRELKNKLELYTGAKVVDQVLIDKIGGLNFFQMIEVARE